jgi:NADPH:quinone reductase-like Zn-dependent oxidoreductase
MRALIVDRFGLEHLRVGEAERSPVGPDDALVRLHAASLNYRDLLVVEGKYDPRFPLPLIPCSDGVGTVLAVGENVSPALVGSRVLPALAPFWLEGPPERGTLRRTLGGPLPGTLAEELVVPATGLVPAPSHLDQVEAATLPCAATTAYRALVELSDTGEETLAGRWVLCLGTGGVSLFALQIAKALGAQVAVTSSDSSKLEIASRLGADLTINYREEPDWGRRVRELTGGVSHVIEIGGPVTLPHSLKAALPGANVSLIGTIAGPPAPVDLLPAVMNQIRLQGVYVGPRESLARTVAFFERHRLRPYIHRTHPLVEGRRAFDELAARAHVGKICITHS